MFARDRAPRTRAARARQDGRALSRSVVVQACRPACSGPEGPHYFGGPEGPHYFRGPEGPHYRVTGLPALASLHPEGEQHVARAAAERSVPRVDEHHAISDRRTG